MKPQLKYFYNPECPKCKELKPVIEELKQLFEIISINTYEEGVLVESLNIQWVPTFILEDKTGQHKFEGVKEITKFIQKVIS